MKCERCGKELSDIDLYCDRCGQAIFPEYMDEEDIWAYYKSDEELEQILKDEQEGKIKSPERKRILEQYNSKKTRKLWGFHKEKKSVLDRVTASVEKAYNETKDSTADGRTQDANTVMPGENVGKEETTADEEITRLEETAAVEFEAEKEEIRLEDLAAEQVEIEENTEPEESVEEKEETEPEEMLESAEEETELEESVELEEEAEPEESVEAEEEESKLEETVEAEEEIEPEETVEVEEEAELEESVETEEETEPDETVEVEEEAESEELVELEEEAEPDETVEVEEEAEPEELVEVEEEAEPEELVEVEEEAEPEESVEAEEETESKPESAEEIILQEERKLEASPVSEENDDAEEITVSEEEDLFDDEEEEDDDEQTLSPERKRSRRRTALISTVFLLACLGAGIFLGMNRMKKLEQQEKDYYDELNKKPVETGSQNVENSEKPEAEKEEKPAEDIKKEDTEKEQQEEEKPEEQKEVKKEEYFKLVNAEEIDFSKYKKIQPASTEENSVKESESYDYSAKSVVDGDTNSSWQENEEGLGEGKGFKLNLDGNHKIRYIVLHLGNWRSDELWRYNARPQALTIQVGDSQKKDVEFADEKKKFCLSFEEPVEASYVSMYIKSAYEGERWDDDCISEVEIYE